MKTKGDGIVAFLPVALIFNGLQGFYWLTTQCSNIRVTLLKLVALKVLPLLS